jgi:hypothetical protein
VAEIGNEMEDGAVAAGASLRRSNAIPPQRSARPTARGQEASSDRPALRPGAALLLDFLRGMALNHIPLADHLQKQTMLVDHADTWHYYLVQGTETEGLDRIRRELVPRLYRAGAKLDGPGWGPVLLGKDFQKSSFMRQAHLLEYTLNACPCLWCLLQEAKAEQSCPSVSSLEDALEAVPESPDLHPNDRLPLTTSPSAGDRVPRAAPGRSYDPKEVGEISHGAAAGGNSDCVKSEQASRDEIERSSHAQRPAIPSGREESCGGPARTRLDELTGVRQTQDPADRASDWPLPRVHDFALLGDCVEHSKFEIGVVSKLSSRGGARFSLTGMMQSFLGHSAYAGPLGMTEMYISVIKFATAYYRQNKGKLERRVYIQGGLVRLPISTSFFVAGDTPHLSSEAGSKGILASTQLVHIFYGTLVLEGSFDTVIATDIPYFVGFGHEKGAQAVYEGGTLGPPRPLGVVELCRHTGIFDAGPLNVQLR